MIKGVGLPMLGGHCVRLDFLGIGQATWCLGSWVQHSLGDGAAQRCKSRAKGGSGAKGQLHFGKEPVAIVQDLYIYVIICVCVPTQICFREHKSSESWVRIPNLWHVLTLYLTSDLICILRSILPQLLVLMLYLLQPFTEKKPIIWNISLYSDALADVYVLKKQSLIRWWFSKMLVHPNHPTQTSQWMSHIYTFVWFRFCIARHGRTINKLYEGLLHPLVNQRSYKMLKKITLLIGTLPRNWIFSIAMWVITRG